MTKKNTRNDVLFRGMQELEQNTLKAGIIKVHEVETSKAMRGKTWRYCLYDKFKFSEKAAKEKKNRITSGYPIKLISNYKTEKIDRQKFIKQFGDWQKKHGMSYTCKGTADKLGVHVEYKGIRATIKNGILHFLEIYTEPNTNKRRYIKNTAETINEFCLKVDFIQNNGGKKWN